MQAERESKTVLLSSLFFVSDVFAVAKMKWLCSKVRAIARVKLSSPDFERAKVTIRRTPPRINRERIFHLELHPVIFNALSTLLI